MAKQRRQKISFKATKIVSRTQSIEFTTKDGVPVYFKAKKDIPKPVRVEFFAKPKRKK